MKLRITALTAALMTALKLRLVWLGGAGPEWLATRVTAMSATPLWLWHLLQLPGVWLRAVPVI